MIDTHKAYHIGPESPADPGIERPDEKGIRLGGRDIDPHDPGRHIVVPDRHEGTSEARAHDTERTCDHNRSDREIHVELRGFADETQPE